MPGDRYIRWFDQIGLDDVPQVGGKTASLGEMYRALGSQGIHVPNGFAITSAAYREILDRADLWKPLRRLMDQAQKDNSQAEIAEEARALIYDAGLPDDLNEEISRAYLDLYEQYGPGLRVAVRSSATAEDLPNASFAGQHDSFLNIGDNDGLLDACRHCFASLFTERAISYRERNGFDHFKVFLAIAVMKMVRADLAASGVMFTLDTDSGFRDVVFINGAYGLGENIVQGTVDPDEFYVHKPTFELRHRCVLRRELGGKQQTLVCDEDLNSQEMHNIDTPDERRRHFCLSDEEVLTLADYAIKTEKLYSDRRGKESPMDIEWAKDGDDGQLYLVQARPETVASQKPRNQLKRYHLAEKPDRKSLLARGRAVGANIASGTLRKIDNARQLVDFHEGEVLFAESTSPDWGPAMRRAAAVITVRGGRTCHAAIVAREFGIPAVVGIGDDSGNLRDGETVTLSCAEGDIGKVYAGKIPFEVTTTELEGLRKPQTKMMINLGSPDQAFRLSALPCDGVGLARMEFIITEYIKAHPMALRFPKRVEDEEARRRITKLTALHESGGDFFIEKLSEGIGTIAAAFYPRPVIVRTSDFKSNEYAQLIGGRAFEPKEDNPMLGFRGAARYAHKAYEAGFALECAAIKRAREMMGLTNIKVMIPFCRRIPEAEQVLKAMAKHGLRQGEEGLEVYVMCEIPNNVVQIDAFSKLFDGISIGSNDLTQLVLGVDRDSDIVAFDFDERDPGVLEMIRWAIEGAHRNGIHAGICGQAPSDYPEVAEYLVRHNIDSISLTPDALLKTIEKVAAIEENRNASPNTGDDTAG
ncbi:phosphoenolpyruvate synthase [Microbulbifer rhizosphaerae]|uniref:Phosphoenolpyruvate synthase n=1 Tax=Microbulbifer rhizosphaerae TaxID=1562603 RepID=A0A7W4W9H9_9GAMM|nr:phosphoenolpyruvate synthase [Microbulbifer rhizosphaerae]MBB3060121.1 pyruvate,water dikinase [Microbulbifer rhizosphaerae]